MNADGSDIRFVDSDDTTPLDYWIESGINTAATIIWVEVPSVLNGTKDIYMYYGNAGAAAVSDGDDTCIIIKVFDGSKETISTYTKHKKQKEQKCKFIHFYYKDKYKCI
jgi:hypothetical protein